MSVPPTAVRDAPVREIGRFERRLTVSLTDADIDAAKSAAARRLSKDLKLHGFRPGKAPRPVVEAAVGAERLRSEAIEDLIPQQLQKLLEEQQLTPVINPQLENITNVDGGVEAEVLITLWPELDAEPSYEGRTIELSSIALTDSDVAESIEVMRNQFASLETVDRPANDGDFVSIDLAAQDQNGPVPETVANELLYEVGSNQLLDEADEHMRGMSAGEEVSFESTLPAGFGDNAGTAVSFTIKVNEVKAKVLPEVDDEWVSEITEFETLAELEDELRKELAVSKQRAGARELRQKALDLLIDEAIVEIPEQLIRIEMEDLLHRFTHRLEESDITIQDYLEASGVTPESLEADLHSQAERGLKSRLVLESVAKKEGIEVTPDDLAKQVAAIARLSKEPEQVYKAMSEESRVLSLAGDILRNKALEAVIAGVKAVDEDGNPVELGTEMADEEDEVVEALPLEDEIVVEAEIVDEEP